MQGLNACRCQRPHVGPGTDHRTRSGNRLDRQRLHCTHARGELGPCGHRHRIDSGGRGHVCRGSTWENGPRLGSDRPPPQGGRNVGTGDGERDSLSQVKGITVFVDLPMPDPEREMWPAPPSYRSWLQSLRCSHFSPVVAASNLCMFSSCHRR